LAAPNEDGYYFVVDRKKDMMIVSGYKVWPCEVEDTLCLEYPRLLEIVDEVPKTVTGKFLRRVLRERDQTETAAPKA
jgi:long-chain acyl-CoA synthetase